jgi:hypothetical protein
MVRRELERRAPPAAASSPYRNRSGRSENERGSDEGSHRTRGNGPDDVLAHGLCKRRNNAKRNRTLWNRATQSQGFRSHAAEPEVLGNRQTQSQGLLGHSTPECKEARCLKTSRCDRTPVDLTRASASKGKEGSRSRLPSFLRGQLRSRECGKHRALLPGIALARRDGAQPHLRAVHRRQADRFGHARDRHVPAHFHVWTECG